MELREKESIMKKLKKIQIEVKAHEISTIINNEKQNAMKSKVATIFYTGVVELCINIQCYTT